MSKRLGWAEGQTITDLLRDMNGEAKPGEEIIFYSITSTVVGYDPWYSAIVTYEKKE